MPVSINFVCVCVCSPVVRVRQEEKRELEECSKVKDRKRKREKYAEKVNRPSLTIMHRTCRTLVRTLTCPHAGHHMLLLLLLTLPGAMERSPVFLPHVSLVFPLGLGFGLPVGGLW